jgi:hypothetical protein
MLTRKRPCEKVPPRCLVGFLGHQNLPGPIRQNSDGIRADFTHAVPLVVRHKFNRSIGEYPKQCCGMALQKSTKTRLGEDLQEADLSSWLTWRGAWNSLEHMHEKLH